MVTPNLEDAFPQHLPSTPVYTPKYQIYTRNGQLLRAVAALISDENFLDALGPTKSVLMDAFYVDLEQVFNFDWSNEALLIERHRVEGALAVCHAIARWQARQAPGPLQILTDEFSAVANCVSLFRLLVETRCHQKSASAFISAMPLDRWPR